MPIHKPIDATPENMRTIANEIARCAADLLAVADAAKAAGFDELKVTGYGQLRSAAKFANNFVAAAKNGLWKAREQRGDFGVIPPEEQEKANGSRRGRKPKKPVSD
jgi:hypothetical protein